MNESIATPTPVKASTPRYALLGLMESRQVSLAEAIWQVRRAKFVGVNTQLNGVQGTIVDLPKRLAVQALKRLRGRVKRVQISDIFGTTVVGQIG